MSVSGGLSGGLSTMNASGKFWQALKINLRLKKLKRKISISNKYGWKF